MHPNHEQVLKALQAKPELALQTVAKIIIMLGAKSEWSMDDNFNTTETLAGLASRYDLPSAGDQTDAALRFYGEAAQALGFETDLDDDDTIGAGV